MSRDSKSHFCNSTTKAKPNARKLSVKKSFNNLRLTLFTILIYLLALTIGGTYGKSIESSPPTLVVTDHLDASQIEEELQAYKSLFQFKPKPQRSKRGLYCDGHDNENRIRLIQRSLGQILSHLRSPKQRRRRSLENYTSVRCCDFSKQIARLLCKIRSEKKDIDIKTVLYHALTARLHAKTLNDEQWNSSSSSRPKSRQSRRSAVRRSAHRIRKYNFTHLEDDLNEMCREFPPDFEPISNAHTKLMLQLDELCSCEPVAPHECPYTAIRIEVIVED